MKDLVAWKLVAVAVKFPSFNNFFLKTDRDSKNVPKIQMQITRNKPSSLDITQDRFQGALFRFQGCVDRGRGLFSLEIRSQTALEIDCTPHSVSNSIGGGRECLFRDQLWARGGVQDPDASANVLQFIASIRDTLADLLYGGFDGDQGLLERDCGHCQIKSIMDRGIEIRKDAARPEKLDFDTNKARPFNPLVSKRQDPDHLQARQRNQIVYCRVGDLHRFAERDSAIHKAD